MESEAQGMTPPTVVIRRRASALAWWLLAAMVVVAASVFFVLDSRGHPLSWAFLGVSVAAAGYFAGQLLPGAVVVTFDQDVLRARTYWRRVEVPWEEIRLAHVRRVAGDPVLAVEVREPSPSGDSVRHRVIAVLLPVGADLDAVHDFLERRLGRRSPLRPPTTVRPLT